MEGQTTDNGRGPQAGNGLDTTFLIERPWKRLEKKVQFDVDRHDGACLSGSDWKFQSFPILSDRFQDSFPSSFLPVGVARPTMAISRDGLSAACLNAAAARVAARALPQSSRARALPALDGESTGGGEGGGGGPAPTSGASTHCRFVVDQQSHGPGGGGVAEVEGALIQPRFRPSS